MARRATGGREGQENNELFDVDAKKSLTFFTFTRREKLFSPQVSRFTFHSDFYDTFRFHMMLMVGEQKYVTRHYKSSRISLLTRKMGESLWKDFRR